MPLPSILLSVLIASLIGSLFHVFVGGGRGKLLIYILVSCAGFFVGHFVGLLRGWLIFMIGALDAGNASLFSIFFLIFAYALERLGLRPGNDRV